MEFEATALSGLIAQPCRCLDWCVRTPHEAGLAVERGDILGNDSAEVTHTMPQRVPWRAELDQIRGQHDKTLRLEGIPESMPASAIKDCRSPYEHKKNNNDPATAEQPASLLASSQPVWTCCLLIIISWRAGSTDARAVLGGARRPARARTRRTTRRCSSTAGRRSGRCSATRCSHGRPPARLGAPWCDLKIISPYTLKLLN